MEKQIIKDRTRKRLQQQLRRFYFGTASSKEFYKYAQCSKEAYRNYINEYLQPDMTEENYGTVWELDHIVPVDLFDIRNEEDLRLCYSMYNIMPLYKKHNKTKSSCPFFSSELLYDRIIKQNYEDVEILLKLKRLSDKAKKEFQIYFNSQF